MEIIDSDEAWAAFAARERRFLSQRRGGGGVASLPALPAGRGGARRGGGGEGGRDPGRGRDADAGRAGGAGRLCAASLPAAVHAGDGISPAAYARARRANRAAEVLTEEKQVTDPICEAGYAAPSRFDEEAPPRLGMAPRAWAGGGAGETIRWTIVPTSLGPLLVAATDKGLCRVSFDEDGGTLTRRFPKATIEEGGEVLADLAARVVAMVERPGRHDDLPLDVRGTAFQEKVWQALKRIPAGSTLSYAQLAAAIGSPAAVRAVGSACGANAVAVAIPCHRALRTDGTLGGYAYGLARKRALLDRERGLNRERG